MNVETLPTRGMTPCEAAERWRMSPDRIRAFIKAGKLKALNTGTRDKPRFVILPWHAREFEQALAAAPPPRPRRRKATAVKDWFPDL